MKIAVVVAAATMLMLAGCAGDPPAAPSLPSSPAHTTAPKPPPNPPKAPDECGAADAQKYVGKPRTEIPVPLIPDWQRVACTTCPVTLEYMPKRLNFLYDAETGIVKEVKCG